jgi:hypothetical protein
MPRVLRLFYLGSVKVKLTSAWGQYARDAQGVPIGKNTLK